MVVTVGIRAQLERIRFTLVNSGLKFSARENFSKNRKFKKNGKFPKVVSFEKCKLSNEIEFGLSLENEVQMSCKGFHEWFWKRF